MPRTHWGTSQHSPSRSSRFEGKKKKKKKTHQPRRHNQQPQIQPYPHHHPPTLPPPLPVHRQPQSPTDPVREPAAKQRAHEPKQIVKVRDALREHPGGGPERGGEGDPPDASFPRAGGDEGGPEGLEDHGEGDVPVYHAGYEDL